MEITVRAIDTLPNGTAKYIEVQVKEGGITLDLGLLSPKEATALASDLAYATHQITQNLS